MIPPCSPPGHGKGSPDEVGPDELSPPGELLPEGGGEPCGPDSPEEPSDPEGLGELGEPDGPEVGDEGGDGLLGPPPVGMDGPLGIGMPPGGVGNAQAASQEVAQTAMMVRANCISLLPAQRGNSTQNHACLPAHH